MPSDVKVQAARNEQSAADKIALLKGKKRRTKDVTVDLGGETITLKFQAISGTEMDKLRAKHPPTAKQRAEGLGVNTDSFAPALVAACSLEPKMSEDDVREIWASDYWGAGELNTLFNAASDVCLEGANIPFTASV